MALTSRHALIVIGALGAVSVQPASAQQSAPESGPDFAAAESARVRACSGRRLAHARRQSGRHTRYSELAKITKQNVGELKVAFTFSMGVNRGQEAAPLVVDDTLYVVSPYPNFLYALDLSQPGAPLKWTFAPAPETAAQGVACCDVVNRGAAFADGRLFFNTLDGQTIAVDAASGEEIWCAKMGDIRVGETMTMAPLVAGNKVLVGNSGGEMGVRGWIAALDTETGEVVWKAFNTGPEPRP